MDFRTLVEKAARLPCFSPAFLSAGEDLAALRVQVSRWVKSGRVIRLNRGLYTLAEPWRKVRAEPFVIANALHRPSYVSLQSALSWHHLIPEYVPVVTSIAAGRPLTIHTPIGTYDYRHVRIDLFSGYVPLALPEGETVFIATPEKALFDLLWLSPGSDDPGFLAGLRLQHLHKLDLALLEGLCRTGRLPKLMRAWQAVHRLASMDEGVEL